MFTAQQVRKGLVRSRIGIEQWEKTMRFATGMKVRSQEKRKKLVGEICTRD